MAKDKETPTGGAWHRDPAVEKTCPIGSCRRDGGEFRASQRLATGTRGSGQSYGPCARNGSRRETPTGEKEQQGRGGGDRGSTAARPTLTRDWGGPQVRDPPPIVSVNPEADPPQPRAPVRPNQAEQDGETAEEKSQSAKCGSSGGNGSRMKERRQRGRITGGQGRGGRPRPGQRC